MLSQLGDWSRIEASSSSLTCLFDVDLDCLLAVRPDCCWYLQGLGPWWGLLAVTYSVLFVLLLP